MVQDEQNLKQESVQIGIESIAVTIAAMSNPLVLYIRQLCRRGKEALQWILNHLDA